MTTNGWLPRSRRMLLPAVLALALVASGAAEEIVPLAVIPLDNIYLKGEPKPVSGRVTERLPDGGYRVRQGTSSSDIVIPGDKVDRWEHKQTAADAVVGHGRQALANGDIKDIEKTVAWGLENGAKEESLAFARQAMAKRSTPDLAEMLVPLLIDQNDLESAAALIKPMIEANVQWTFGYENLARIYQLQKRDAELLKLVELWHERQPSALTPNRYRAAAAELSGDLRTAQRSYNKGFDLHHDYESGLGYARTSLKLGARSEALTTAEALIAAGQFVDEARAYAGSAHLALGAADKAEPLLTQALSGKLTPETAEMVRYNLGVIAYRTGRPDEARNLWKDLRTPAAELGLAMIDRRPYQRSDSPPELKAVAAEFNACVDLENKRYDQGLAQLEGKTKRQLFLAQIAALKNPTEEAVRALAQTASVESLRWQAYGHILARRYPQAEAALAALPPNDGYAAVYRVFMAEAQKDSAGARVLFAAVKDSLDPPRDYVASLMREYETADDQLVVEHFDAPLAELMNRDWKVMSRGTGILPRTDGGRLVFEGMQTAGEDPVTRIYHEYPAAALRSIAATLDLAGISGAACGIEMLDAGRANGIAYGVQSDNHLGWRELKQGTWGPWQPLPQEAQTIQVLRLELDRGFVTAVSIEGTQFRKQLGSGLFKDQPTLCVGVFGTADVGTAWSLGVKDFTAQLRSEKQGTKSR